ncbi:MAG: thioredoxin family protein [Gemmatimonadaceae bacterium]|nr:thioredoxin family protein [Chitinophagaceae bacterium]
MHKFIILAITSWFLVFSCAEKPADKGVKLQWMTLQEAQVAMQKEKKPLLIDLYTDWCGWCKVMDKKTYSNKNVVEYLQKNFYPVKLNAETKESLNYNNKTYSYNQANRANDIAIYLTYGQLSYPTTIIIADEKSGPQPIPGFMEPKDFEPILKYFGEGKFGKQRFEEYQKTFKSSW